MARQIKYLKVENEILRSKLPKHITVSRSGNQAEFTIVGFAGGRILDAELTGSNDS